MIGMVIIIITTGTRIHIEYDFEYDFEYFEYFEYTNFIIDNDNDNRLSESRS